jgi:hypothetical protein
MDYTGPWGTLKRIEGLDHRIAERFRDSSTPDEPEKIYSSAEAKFVTTGFSIF